MDFLGSEVLETLPDVLGDVRQLDWQRTSFQVKLGHVGSVQHAFTNGTVGFCKLGVDFLELLAFGTRLRCEEPRWISSPETQLSKYFTDLPSVSVTKKVATVVELAEVLNVEESLESFCDFGVNVHPSAFNFDLVLDSVDDLVAMWSGWDAKDLLHTKTEVCHDRDSRLGLLPIDVKLTRRVEFVGVDRREWLDRVARHSREIAINKESMDT
jgi:hypothetical protein